MIVSIYLSYHEPFYQTLYKYCYRLFVRNFQLVNMCV